MVCRAGLRVAGRSSMVGAGSLLHRLAAVKSSLIAPPAFALASPASPSASASCAAVAAGRLISSSSSSCGASPISQWKSSLIGAPAASSSPCAFGGREGRGICSGGANSLVVRWKNGGVREGRGWFLGGEEPMVGIAVPEGFGRSLRGVRMMGGGPRTFPGGVSKWQWKRMQEKKERQIEKARLLRERQAFEERRRQEVLAGSPGSEKPWERSSPPGNPLSPSAAATDPRVRALADRFRRNGGEDLWTEEDGPEVANGLPGRVSARFLPDKPASASFSGAQRLQNSPGRHSRPAAATTAGGDWDGMFRNARGAGENSGAMKAARVGVRRGMEDGGPSPRGGQAPSGLVGKLDNLSINRKFSSSVDQLDSERDVSTTKRDRHSTVGKKPAQRSLGGSGSGKRVAEIPQSAWTGNIPQDKAEQQRKKVRPTPGKDSNSDNSTPSHLSDTRFDQFAISPLSIRALHEVMGYEKMTRVQEATFPVILEGRDVLAKAKTGTGKTIAFLLPSVEAILKAERSGNANRSSIYVLIICPTRELASQASAEAKTLFTYHKKLDAQIVIGGTNMNTESNNLQNKPCQVLVATPGRLLDHMKTSRSVLQQLSQLKVLVLDEADRLLDMGFKKDLDRIISMLPAARQTLLFSATVPPEVHKVSQAALKKEHVFIDTVGKDDEETHAKVQQQYVLVPLDDQLAAICTILEKHIAEEPDYKVLVFCTTARVTGLMAEFSTRLGYNTLEIHSRKSQAFRTRVSDTFRNSEGGVIMFTSDVSARGVDYPDVTLVIQMGIPSGREDYIHRLGRTGRAGKEGQGILVLAPWEQQFLRALKDISITECTDLKLTGGAKAKAESAIMSVSMDAKEKAYAAWLGYYNSARMLALNKTELVRLANHFSSTLGLDEPPALMKKTIGMMGLRGVPGLRIQ